MSPNSLGTKQPSCRWIRENSVRRGPKPEFIRIHRQIPRQTNCTEMDGDAKEVGFWLPWFRAAFASLIRIDFLCHCHISRDGVTVQVAIVHRD